ncbi:MAG: type II secretion system protein GspE, partial [Betaproteobacteria bacterium]
MDAARLVPHACARGTSILGRPGAVGAEVWSTEAPPPAALAEVQRSYVGALQPVLGPPEQLHAELARAYAAGEGSAQQIVGDLESDVDIARLMQDVPDVEDLLDAAGDAPVIR